MFTIFSEDWDHAVLRDERVKCAAVQQEKCPDTGREHFQGFVQLVKPMRLMSIKSLLKCDSAHLERTKGSPIQAWDYCTKEETRIGGPWTYGDKPGGQGKRQVLYVIHTQVHSYVPLHSQPRVARFTRVPRDWDSCVTKLGL